MTRLLLLAVNVAVFRAPKEPWLHMSGGIRPKSSFQKQTFEEVGRRSCACAKFLL